MVKRALLSLVALAGITLLTLPACSSIGMLSGGERYLMGGTRENILVFSASRDQEYFIGLKRAVGICDFPFSLVVDLLLSPVTLPLQVIHGDKQKPTSNPTPGDDENEP